MIKNFYIFLLILLIPLILYSQSGNTANISGSVEDNNGTHLAGATIKVIHIGSGTVAGAITNSSGRFNILGLRVGGPYEIRVTMLGYQSFMQQNIYLNINQTLNLKVELNQSSVSKEEIFVTSNKNDVISSDRTGAAQYVGEAQIKSLPSISRSISDYTRLSPLVTSSSESGVYAGGRNNKFNNIQIDGAVISDQFGLTASGTNGGSANAQPISLDVIQEVQVSVAPYDVRLGGFTGGLINAVTKSGTNNFNGSLYLYGRNESLVGKNPVKATDGSRSPYPKFSENQFGLTVGGPILKDELFFFANVDIKNKVDPQRIGFNDPTFPTNYLADKSLIEDIRQISIDNYNYDPGALNNWDRETKDYKIFLKLDYNLNQKNRLSLRHNYVNAEQGNDILYSPTLFTFNNREYKLRSKTNQTVLQLNSTFYNSLANEAHISYTSVDDVRDPLSRKYPDITISKIGANNTQAKFGIDRSSQANAINQDVLEITDNLNYFYENHVFTLGFSIQNIHFENLFLQDYYGFYEFNSIDDFKNGKIARYRNSYSLDKNIDKPLADFSYWQLAYYLQDEWNISDGLKLNLGLRIDQFLYSKDPLKNETFKSAFPNYSTNEMPAPLGIAPRIGFNYDLNGDKSIQLRGGAGLFTGKAPGVWISNQYSNTGMDIGRINITNPNFKFSKNLIDNVPTPYNDTSLATIKTTAINITDKDLQMPQIFRIDFGADYELEEGIITTFEILYGKTISDMDFVNLNIQKAKSFSGGDSLAKDGRPVYSSTKANTANFTDIILMKNTSKGDQLNICIQLQKEFGKGFLPELSANFAYTFSKVRDVNPGTSTVAYSNWQNIIDTDPNNRILGTSIFEIPHRFLANINYKFDFKLLDDKDWSTTIGLFFEGRSGSPYTFAYNGNANNDGTSSTTFNDMIYVPSNENDDKVIMVRKSSSVKNTPAEMWSNLNSLISSSKELESQRGKIMEKNSLNQPWRNILDMRISQMIPTISGQNLEIYLDIFNVLNLLKSDWGMIKSVNNNAYDLMNFEGYVVASDIDNAIDTQDANSPKFTANDLGKMKISYTKGFKNIDDIFGYQDLASRWQLQLGIRYNF